MQTDSQRECPDFYPLGSHRQPETPFVSYGCLYFTRDALGGKKILTSNFKLRIISESLFDLFPHQLQRRHHLGILVSDFKETDTSKIISFLSGASAFHTNHSIKRN